MTFREKLLNWCKAERTWSLPYIEWQFTSSNMEDALRFQRFLRSTPDIMINQLKAGHDSVTVIITANPSLLSEAEKLDTAIIHGAGEMGMELADTVLFAPHPKWLTSADGQQESHN